MAALGAHRKLLQAGSSRWAFVCTNCSRLVYSTAQETAGAPPLLLKLRSDLKSAMKAKDTNRLNVLRAILAETTNASKTSTPFKTDIQLLSLLKKHAAASKAAALEFEHARRDDLRDKENAQAAVLEEYASNVDTVGEKEMTEMVTIVIDQMRTNGKNPNTGSVLKALLGHGGAFEGKPVEKAEVAKIVTRLM